MNTLLTELCSYLGLKPEHTELLNERDTSDVWRQFAIWLLVDLDHGVIRFTKPDSERYQAIKNVAHLYAENCEDETIWHKAAWAARSAACSAFDAAWAAAFSAEAAAARAAEAAVEAAYYAGADAAEAADDAAAYYAAASVKAAAKDAAQVAAAWATARAADAAAGAAAWAEAHRRMADKLLELLQSAPPKEAK